MAQVIVRNLDDDVKQRLSARAARRGHSMEQEIREILSLAVESEPARLDPLGSRIAQRFAGRGLGPDEALEEIHGAAKPASFRK